MMVISSNLFRALGRLRLGTKPRLLWIDATSTNQADFEEKSRQIPLLRSIYTGDKRVLIWLGGQATDSSKALALMSKLSEIDEDDFEDKSRAALFCEPPSGFTFMPDFLRGLVSSTSDDWESDSGSSSILAHISRAVGKMITDMPRSFIKTFVPGAPESESSSDDDSIDGTDLHSKADLPPRGNRA
jgi:hypothetical protein